MQLPIINYKLIKLIRYLKYVSTNLIFCTTVLKYILSFVFNNTYFLIEIVGYINILFNYRTKMTEFNST